MDRISLALLGLSGVDSAYELGEHYKAQEDFDVIETDDYEVLGKILDESGQGIVLLKVNDKKTLSEALVFLKKHKEQIRLGIVKVLALLFIKNRKVKKNLKDLGCHDVLDHDVMKSRLAIRKIDYIAKNIKSKIDSLKAEKGVPHSTGEEEGEESNCFKYVDPLDFEGDVWIVKDRADNRLVRGEFLLRMVGPSPFVGNWHELENQSSDVKMWKFMLRDEDNKSFIADNGAWYFTGSKPDFDWTDSRWIFSSSAPHLYFYTNKNVTYSRLKYKDGCVIICENSEFATTKEDKIMELCDIKYKFQIGDDNTPTPEEVEEACGNKINDLQEQREELDFIEDSHNEVLLDILDKKEKLEDDSRQHGTDMAALLSDLERLEELEVHHRAAIEEIQKRREEIDRIEEEKEERCEELEDEMDEIVKLMKDKKKKSIYEGMEDSNSKADATAYQNSDDKPNKAKSLDELRKRALKLDKEKGKYEKEINENKAEKKKSEKKEGYHKGELEKLDKAKEKANQEKSEKEEPKERVDKEIEELSKLEKKTKDKIDQTKEQKGILDQLQGEYQEEIERARADEPMQEGDKTQGVNTATDIIDGIGLNIESGELKIDINKKGTKVHNIGYLEDLYQEKVVIGIEDGVLEEDTDYIVQITFKYNGKKAVINSEATLEGMDEPFEGKVSASLKFKEKISSKEHNTFMVLCQRRQSSIEDFMTLAKG